MAGADDIPGTPGPPTPGADAIAAVVGDALGADKKESSGKRDKVPASDVSRSVDGSPSSPLGRDKKPGKKPPPIVKRAMLDINDQGMALRLSHYAKGKLLYCDPTDWAVFDGKRFDAQDGEALARQALMGCTPKIKFKEYPALKSHLYGEAEQALEESDIKTLTKAANDVCGRLWKAAIALGNNNKQVAVLKVAAALSDFRVQFNDLDAHPGLFNGDGQIIDLPLTAPGAAGMSAADNFELGLADFIKAGGRKAAPKDKITRVGSVPVNFRALSADEDLAPTWHAHIKKIMPDPKMRKLLQRVLGSLLVNYNPMNTWFIFQGEGGDGKSTTIKAVQNVLGDYFRTGTIDTILFDSRRSAGGTRSDLMDLAGGTRAVLFPEPTEKQELDGTIIKTLTGGEEISTREVYAGQTRFLAQFKMIMMVNALPRVVSKDKGFWRRPIFIRFPVSIPDEDKDPDIDAKLEAEAAGILLYMIEGFFDWWSRGFRYEAPASALNELNEYKRKANPVEAWAQDRILWGKWYNSEALRKAALDKPGDIWAGVRQGDGPMTRIAGRDYTTNDPNTSPPPRYEPKAIYDDFKAWCEAAAQDPWKQNGFARVWSDMAKAKGVKPGRTGATGRFWHGFDFVTGDVVVPGLAADDDAYGDPRDFEL